MADSITIKRLTTGLDGSKYENIPGPFFGLVPIGKLFPPILRQDYPPWQIDAIVGLQPAGYKCLINRIAWDIITLDENYFSQLSLDNNTKTIVARSVNHNYRGAHKVIREHYVGPDSITGAITNNAVPENARVQLFNQEAMQLIGETSGTSYAFYNLNPDLTYALVAYSIANPSLDPLITYNLKLV